MPKPQPRPAIFAAEAPLRARASLYPALFAERVAGREKRPLGDLFGLTNFGVNLTTLAPGAQSALLHRHSRQDEFVYVLEGTPTLVTENGAFELRSGMCAGFQAGGEAHHPVNRSTGAVVYLEIGDRGPGDEAAYPEDDLKAVLADDGQWSFTHKDGQPY